MADCASVAVGLGRLGRLPGDRLGLGREGAALLVGDGFGEGDALLVGDGFGEGDALLVGDGVVLSVGDGVAVGVSEVVGDGSALGVALGTADGDEAAGEADGEGLGSADALAGRMRAAPAIRTPTTARAAVRAPTSIRPPKASYPDRQHEQGLNGCILLERRKQHHICSGQERARYRLLAPRPGILDICRACMKPQAAWMACSGWPRRGIAG
jgi:hypothetical protein